MSGKPVTSRPGYGYLMGEDERFILDEAAAPVVQQIYSFCLAGNGPAKIARMLAEQQIPTPGTLDYIRTGNTNRYYPNFPYKWATNTVVHILERREYTGCLVNFKTTMQSYKVHKIIYNSEEEWAVFENAHEPIIDKETWERVQELRKQRKRPPAMIKLVCSPAYSFVPTAAAFSISSVARPINVSRIVISAAATRNGLRTAPPILYAPTF